MSLGPAPILVAACGNSLAGDDAFGPLLVELLRREPLEGVEAADLGMNPGLLLDLLDGESREALVIADAVTIPGVPAGMLIDCAWDGRPALADERSTSTHGLSIAGQVELARSLGLLPQIVRLVGVTVSESVPDVESPSSAIAGQLAPARNRIAQLIHGRTVRSFMEMRHV